jgi:hypothetical protein
MISRTEIWKSNGFDGDGRNKETKRKGRSKVDIYFSDLAI